MRVPCGGISPKCVSRLQEAAPHMCGQQLHHDRIGNQSQIGVVQLDVERANRKLKAHREAGFLNLSGQKESFWPGELTCLRAQPNMPAQGQVPSP